MINTYFTGTRARLIVVSLFFSKLFSGANLTERYKLVGTYLLVLREMKFDY